MVRRRQRRHLVPVPRVLKEEQLDLLRNLRTPTRRVSARARTASADTMGLT